MTDTPSIDLKWSQQYTVRTDATTQALPGDKILLPPSALEALLSASSNVAAENARRDLPRYDPFNSATFSAYRQAESQYNDQRQQLPYPLTFRLVNPENGRAVFCGIREFSANEGSIVLSRFLMEALGLDADTLHNGAHTTDVDGTDEEGTGELYGPMLTAHAKQLPKGTFVKLRPLEAGYDPEDWKALLEQHMRANYTTLTNGEVLVVPGGRGSAGKKEEYRFLIDGFKPEVDGICVVDTDLEVDIEALNEEQARETLKRIHEKISKAPGTEEGSSSGGDLALFRAVEDRVLPGNYVDYQLTSWDRTQPLEFELEATDDEDELINLFVSPLSNSQRARPRIHEFVFADLDSRPRKRIRLEPSNVELEHADELYVAVHAFSPNELAAGSPVINGAKQVQPSRYKLRASHPNPKDDNVHCANEHSGAAPTDDDVRCRNCGQWVPKRTLMLHENFCLRNNVLCAQGCGQVFQRRSPEYESHWHCSHDSCYGNTAPGRQQHDAIYHPPEVLRCSECATSETFPSLPLLARHRTGPCPGKQILCRFCHLVVPQEGDPDVPNAEALLSGMTPHELADGARTTECHMCSKIVRLRDMETHMKNHDLDRFSRPTPIPCRNVNCGRTLDSCSKTGDTRAGTRMGQGPGNDVGLCSVCFGPLYVSMYDPENKALRRRIERRYLQQLLTGCGKPWCKNEFCKNGRKNLDMSTNMTTKDAIPLVKPFLDGLTRTPHTTPLHFCVDESSQKRRNLAQMVAAEDGGPGAKGGYGFEWCVGALEAQSGDLDGARAWLKNYAPARAEERR